MGVQIDTLFLTPFGQMRMVVWPCFVGTGRLNEKRHR